MGTMAYRVEIEREHDGRWLAEVVDLPGCMAYGATSADAPPSPCASWPIAWSMANGLPAPSP